MLRHLIIAILFLSSALHAMGADHSDTALHVAEGRNDARITDLYAFTKGDNIVLILGVDPTVPGGATSYKFPTDVEYRFNIDNDSEVTAQGTLVNKGDIQEDIVISIRFNDDGTAVINGDNKFGSIFSIPFLVLFSCASSDDVDIEDAITNFFAGPREDPFIRGPRIGKNVAAIVLEIPIDAVVKNNNPLLIWSTTNVDSFPGDFQERAGGPITSMLNDVLNSTHPNQDFENFGIEPDVLSLNPALPSGFPNGRALEDDVVDLVCPGVCDNILENDAPFPSENDVPFLDDFPYLAPPH